MLPRSIHWLLISQMQILLYILALILVELLSQLTLFPRDLLLIIHQRKIMTVEYVKFWSQKETQIIFMRSIFIIILLAAHGTLWWLLLSDTKLRAKQNYVWSVTILLMFTSGMIKIIIVLWTLRNLSLPVIRVHTICGSVTATKVTISQPWINLKMRS